MLGHLLGSILGLILAIFGTFALGAYLATSRAGHLGLVAMALTVFGSALFLPGMGVSAFAAPEEGQAYLAGIEEFHKLPPTFADTMFALTSLLFVVLVFVGNFAPRRSGLALWGAAQVGWSPLGRCARAAVLESRIRADDWTGEHPADG